MAFDRHTKLRAALNESLDISLLVFIDPNSEWTPSDVNKFKRRMLRLRFLIDYFNQ